MNVPCFARVRGAVALGLLLVMTEFCAGESVTEKACDVDGDGVIAPADVLAFVDYLNSVPEARRFRGFDFDGTGRVDWADVSALAPLIRDSGSCARPRRRTVRRHEAGALAASPRVQVDLVPDRSGPYGRGAVVKVEIAVRRTQAGLDLPLRGLQLDPEESYPGLLVDSSYPGYPDSVCLRPFFDFSSQTHCGGDSAIWGCAYDVYNDPRTGFRGPIAAVYRSGIEYPGLMLTIPGDGTPRDVGSFSVHLPDVPGMYLIDMLNAQNADVNCNTGARIDFGFASRTTWCASNGDFTGGRILLEVANSYAPIIANVAASQDSGGSGRVTIRYDVSDPDNGALTISLRASDDGGATWDVPVRSLAGDVGTAVRIGAGKRIYWDSAADVPGLITELMVQVCANDGSKTGTTACAGGQTNSRK